MQQTNWQETVEAHDKGRTYSREEIVLAGVTIIAFVEMIFAIVYLWWCA